MSTNATVGEEVKQGLEAVLENLSRAAEAPISPRAQLLDLKDVCRATRMKDSTIYKLIEEGRFPKPQNNLGKNLWRESALIAWLDRNDPNLEGKG